MIPCHITKNWSKIILSDHKCCVNNKSKLEFELDLHLTSLLLNNEMQNIFLYVFIADILGVRLTIVLYMLLILLLFTQETFDYLLLYNNTIQKSRNSINCIMTDTSIHISIHCSYPKVFNNYPY